MFWRKIFSPSSGPKLKKQESIERPPSSTITKFVDGFFGRISKVMTVGAALLGMGCAEVSHDTEAHNDSGASVMMDSSHSDVVPTTVAFSPELDAESDSVSIPLWSMVDNNVRAMHKSVPEKTQELTTVVITKELVSSLDVPHGHVKLHSEAGWDFFKGKLLKWGGYEDILLATEGATTLHQATMFLRTTKLLPGAKEDLVKMADDLIREAALIPNSKIVTSVERSKELKRGLAEKVQLSVATVDPLKIKAPSYKASWAVSESTPTPDSVSLVVEEEPAPKAESFVLPPAPDLGLLIKPPTPPAKQHGILGEGEPDEGKIKALVMKKRSLNEKSNVLSFLEKTEGAAKQVFGPDDTLQDEPVEEAKLVKEEADEPEVDVFAPVEPDNSFEDESFDDWDIDPVEPIRTNLKDMDLDADPPEDFGYIPLKAPSLKAMIRPIDGLSDPTDCLEPKNLSIPVQEMASIFDVPEPVSLQRKIKLTEKEAVAIPFKAPQECLDPTDCPEPGFMRFA